MVVIATIDKLLLRFLNLGRSPRFRQPRFLKLFAPFCTLLTISPDQVVPVRGIADRKCRFKKEALRIRLRASYCPNMLAMESLTEITIPVHGTSLLLTAAMGAGFVPTNCRRPRFRRGRCTSPRRSPRC